MCRELSFFFAKSSTGISEPDRHPEPVAPTQDMPLTQSFQIRPYAPQDADALFCVFYRAVHEGAAAHYSTRQRQAWAPETRPSPRWQAKLGDQITMVGETSGTEGPQGFMTLGHDGFLDFAFVLPEQRRSGLAHALHDRILNEARLRGIARLETEASHLARRFFLKCGWCERAAQQVERGGVMLENFKMDRRV